MRGAEGPKHCIYLPFPQKQKKLYYCLKVIDIIIQTWLTRLREAKVKPKACDQCKRERSLNYISGVELAIIISESARS